MENPKTRRMKTMNKTELTFNMDSDSEKIKVILKINGETIYDNTLNDKKTCKMIKMLTAAIMLDKEYNER